MVPGDEYHISLIGVFSAEMTGFFAAALKLSAEWLDRMRRERPCELDMNSLSPVELVVVIIGSESLS